MAILRNEPWRGREGGEDMYPRHMNVPERITLAGRYRIK